MANTWLKEPIGSREFSRKRVYGCNLPHSHEIKHRDGAECICECHNEENHIKESN